MQEFLHNIRTTARGTRILRNFNNKTIYITRVTAAGFYVVLLFKV